MASSSNNNTSSSSSYQDVPFSSFLNLPQPPSLFDPHFPTFRSSSNPINDGPSSSLQAVQPQPTTLRPSTSSSSRPNNSSSKKRSRASRRAPTTVLTTDTSNFRAMVQEFTGFPAPPFPSSSSPSSAPFPLRPRLDLSSLPYNNLSRPFPQRIPASTPSSLLDAINANINSTSGSYQFVNQSSLIGSGPLLAPQFGDLGSLVAASEAMQQQQQAAAGLPSWAADRQEFGEGSGRDHDQDEFSTPHDFQPEKRQKTTDGSVESWIHSSD